LEGIAYAVFEGHATNDYTPYTYKTTDFGKHGNQLLLILMVLFVTFKILPMKTYYTWVPKGLYITIDGGANWSHFTNKMPSVCTLYGIKYQNQFVGYGNSWSRGYHPR
jgi:hypothetical protein